MNMNISTKCWAFCLSLSVMSIQYWSIMAYFYDTTASASTQKLSFCFAWRRHQMEIFSALLALCGGNSPVNSPHKGQWRGTLVSSLICAWIHGWVNNRKASDLRRHRAHYDIIVMMRITHWENRGRMSSFHRRHFQMQKFSLKFVRIGSIKNTPALVQIVAWRRTGDKPLFESMAAYLGTQICFTLPQWVKYSPNLSPEGYTLSMP